ncbi:MAG TPA: hypothetical protein PKE30_11045 [Niabella sp.]|nr:hypothetical protein [Niabella sp.]
MGVTIVHAQRNDTIRLALQEQLALTYNAQKNFYRSAALRTWQNQFNHSSLHLNYFNNASDIYLPQLGSGADGFSIASESFKKLQQGLTLWGNASYKNKKIRNIVYNETSDYDIVYPYVMSDTVGGDLKSETYYFNGGLLKNFRKISVGFEGAYTGELAYRKRDPRPENTSSKIDVILAVSKRLVKDYRIALDLKGSKYHQRNTLSFASNLGAPNIYHDAGLGTYNDLLDGTNASALFNGNNKGVMLGLISENRKGIMFTSGFDQLVIKKRLNNVVGDIGKLTENKGFADLGYLLKSNKSSYLIKLFGSIKNRKSLEANFNNRGDDIGFVKISESERFSHHEATAGLSITADNIFKVPHLTLSFKTGRVTSSFKYINPNRKLDAVQWNSIFQVGHMLPVKKALLTTSARLVFSKNIEASNHWPDVMTGHTFYNMLNQMYTFYSSNYYGLGALTRIDIPAFSQFGIYGLLDAEYKNYSAVYNGKGYNIHVGLGVTF